MNYNCEIQITAKIFSRIRQISQNFLFFAPDYPNNCNAGVSKLKGSRRCMMWLLQNAMFRAPVGTHGLCVRWLSAYYGWTHEPCVPTFRYCRLRFSLDIWGVAIKKAAPAVGRVRLWGRRGAGINVIDSISGFGPGCGGGRHFRRGGRADPFRRGCGAGGGR